MKYSELLNRTHTHNSHRQTVEEDSVKPDHRSTILHFASKDPLMVGVTSPDSLNTMPHTDAIAVANKLYQCSALVGTSDPGSNSTTTISNNLISGNLNL